MILLQHRRYSHASHKRIQQTAQSTSTTGIYTYGTLKIKCPCCMLTNAIKAPFKRAATTRSLIPGERIHSDLKELSVRSKQGYKWAICFIGDYSRRGMIYFLKRKSEALDRWRQFLEEEVAVMGYKVKYLRSDNGGEYIGEMVAFNNVRAIRPEYSPPHCQSGNGVAENYWRETFRLTRSNLWDQQREDDFWPTGAGFGNHTKNHMTTSAVPDRVPEAAWHQVDSLPQEHFRVLLCRAWCFIEKKNRDGTLGHRRVQGVFVGYARNSPCYLIWEEATNIIWCRRYADCEFDESNKAPDGVDPQSAVADTLLAQLEIQQHVNAQADATLTMPMEVDPVLELTNAPADPVLELDNAPADPVLEPTNAPADIDETPTAPPTPTGANGFVRTTRNWTVLALAQMLGADPDHYLAQLRSYGRWYLGLTTTRSNINKGSDVPIPLSTKPLSRNQRKKRKKARNQHIEHEIEGVNHKIHITRAVQARSHSLDGLANAAQALSAIEASINDVEALWHEHALLAQGWQTQATPTIPTEVALASSLLEPTAPKALAPKHFDAAHKASDSEDWTRSEKKEWDGLWNTGTFEDQPYAGQSYTTSSGHTRSNPMVPGNLDSSSTDVDKTPQPTMRYAALPCDSPRSGSSSL